MSYFYTNFARRGNQILYSGYRDGKKFFKKVQYKPSLFVPTTNDSRYLSYDGSTKMGRIKFDSMSDAKNYLNEFEGIEGHQIHGMTQFEYAFISDEYEDAIDYDLSQIKIMYFDIETTAEAGFPNMQSFNEQVIAITCAIGRLYVVFAFDPFSSSREEKYKSQEGVHYIECESEKELLEKFVEFVKDSKPDIISGYNSDFFDIPYLVGRMDRIVGPGFSSKLSPWSEIRTRRMSVGTRDYTAHDFLGLVSIDYMEIYKKFANKKPENHRLETLARDELNESKLDYEGPYRELYTKHWQKFIDYNVQDVRLVQRLEEKLKLIEMVVTIAYEAKVNFIDVYKQVRLWDIIIFNHFRKKNIIIPPKNDLSKGEKYAGAAVKDVLVGMHDWVVSFDVNSLYPMLIVQYNISPEKLLDFHKQNVTIEQMLSKEVNLDFLKENNTCLTANGYQFDKSSQGFLPEIIETMYKERKSYKKKMLESKSQLQLVKDELKRRKLCR